MPLCVDTMPCSEPRGGHEAAGIYWPYGGAASFAGVALAQQSERVRRIGILMNTTADADQQAGITSFRQTLEQLGWTDGRNVQIEVRWRASKSVDTQTNWSRSRRTSSWQQATRTCHRYCRRRTPCQLFLTMSPTRSVLASRKLVAA